MAVGALPGDLMAGGGPGTSRAATEMFLKTFREFPPRQRAASFTIDQAMEKLGQSPGR